MYRPSPAMKRRENVFSSGRMASRDLPLSRTITDITDKCKISIMIELLYNYVCDLVH